MVKKDDWKRIDMPKERDSFLLDIDFDYIDEERLKNGFLPSQMEDKWFIYSEDDKVYMHRSWTGYCIFILDLKTHMVVVNRNDKQYAGKDFDGDKKVIMGVLDFFRKR